MLDVIIDTLKDTLILIPLLLIIHFLINYFEVRNMKSLRKSRLLNGPIAPLLGASIALFPQCGFSVIASELYAKKEILVGTLVAVFISTSDEALPIIFSSAITDASLWLKLLEILGIKALMAIFAGYFLNFIFRKKTLNQIDENDDHTEYGCCGHAVVGAPKECSQNHEHHHEQDEKRSTHIWHTYFKHPIIHTLIISLYILMVNFILGTIIFIVNSVAGESAFETFLSSSTYFQPLFAAMIGLVPNCASSVLISKMFVNGTLSLGATIAGLSVNAGLGVAVLIKENKNVLHNILIILGLVIYAVVVGYFLTILNI